MWKWSGQRDTFDQGYSFTNDIVLIEMFLLPGMERVLGKRHGMEFQDIPKYEYMQTKPGSQGFIKRKRIVQYTLKMVDSRQAQNKGNCSEEQRNLGYLIEGTK